MIFKSARVPLSWNFVFFCSFFLAALFLLVALFFFIVPAVSRPSGLSLLLPKALSSEAMSLGAETVMILADGRIVYRGQGFSLQEFSKVFARRVRLRESVLIKADHRITLAQLTGVWDVLREAGFAQIFIATGA